MKQININIKTLKHFNQNLLPKHATKHSAGVDLQASIESDILVKCQEIITIPTGIAIEIPAGFEGQIRPRSGLSSKHGITLINSPGTIDSDYRGEIKIPIINLGQKDFYIKTGMRIAQLVISEYRSIVWSVVKKFQDSTERGQSGLGSTGFY